MRVIFRVTLAAFGGYVASAGWSATLALALRGALGRGDAAVLAAMLAFVFFWALALWLTTTPRLARAGLVTLGVTLAGAGHNDVLDAARGAYLAGVETFLREVKSEPRPSGSGRRGRRGWR